MEHVGSIQAREGPVNFEALAIDGAIPGGAFGAQLGQRCEAPGTQTLAREDADLDLGLIQPTGMFWSVVDSEAIPQIAAGLFAVAAHQRTASMGA